MSFKQKYTIKKQYLTAPSKRRSGEIIAPAVKFIVAHDTGNANSTAAGNVSYYESSKDSMYASAHIFVDDKEIIECIPALTSDAPEKAWHVRYGETKDNEIFGADANDVAIGVEYCFGDVINANEAYARYAWVMAYICSVYKLDPRISIVGHAILDPTRRTDPGNGLSKSGRTYEQLLKDIITEYADCIKEETTMKLIKNSSSNKVYAVGADTKKHWIFNLETLQTGQSMGLWGSEIEIKNDDPYAEGHAIILARP